MNLIVEWRPVSKVKTFLYRAQGRFEKRIGQRVVTHLQAIYRLAPDVEGEAEGVREETWRDRPPLL